MYLCLLTVYSVKHEFLTVGLHKRSWWTVYSFHVNHVNSSNLKGPHGNLSKYKFGLAEYITVYVIQLQQLLQLLLICNNRL